MWREFSWCESSQVFPPRPSLLICHYPRLTTAGGSQLHSSNCLHQDRCVSEAGGGKLWPVAELDVLKTATFTTRPMIVTSCCCSSFSEIPQNPLWPPTVSSLLTTGLDCSVVVLGCSHLITHCGPTSQTALQSSCGQITSSFWLDAEHTNTLVTILKQPV